MSTTNKHTAHGIVFEFDLDGMPTWTAVPQIRRFEGLGMSVSDNDVTTHDSGANKEFIPGQTVDNGDVTLEMIWDPDAAPTNGQNWFELSIGVRDKAFRVTFPSTDDQAYTFGGYVKEFSPVQADDDGVLTRTAIIKISGGITRVS